MRSAQTMLAPIIAHAMVGLKVMDGRVLTLMNARFKQTIVVTTHFAQTVSAPLVARAVMDMRATDGRALTLMNAGLELMNVTLMPVA